jgi:ribosomal protein L7Ae-like RNA K-turn-binding protein
MDEELPVEPAAPTKPVERLFPFVLKTRGLVVGREALRANRGKLHFVLITTDIADYNRDEVLKDFTHYPVVQHFTAAELEKFFNVKGAKAVGFLKSGLAQSIYAELKAHRLNKPEVKPTPPKSGKASSAPVNPTENP